MKINKTLVKHEWRNMKWMLLYFTLLSLGTIFLLKSSFESDYLSVLVNGFYMNEGIVFENVYSLIRGMTPYFGLGILIMIYMQFKDSKSLEVGRFLKSLPISSREYYITKLISGIISYTIPFIIMTVGVLIVRGNNISWIQDYHNISRIPEIFIKQSSSINILSLFIMCYFIITATYTFLFMIQYLVMNIVGGIVIGFLTWLAPTFILGSLSVIYREITFKLMQSFKGLYKVQDYILPWSYHINIDSEYIESTFNNMGYNNENIAVLNNMIPRTIICLIISVVCIGLAYTISKKSRVEDTDNLIAFKTARKIFVIGVTVCSALLSTLILGQVFSGRGINSFILVHIIMFIGGFIGFIGSRKISNMERK